MIAALIAFCAWAEPEMIPMSALDVVGLLAPPIDVRMDDGTKWSLAAQKGKIVVVSFWASWCGPCRAIAPSVEQLAGEYKGKFKIGKMNIDENEKIPQQFNISSIPTLLVFKAGKQAGQIIGAVPKAKIEGEMKRHLA